MSSHSTRGHSEIGASSAYRWLKCPGSVALLDRFPMPSSDAADYGTQAHELAECMLVDTGFVNSTDDYTEEQIELVTEYVDWVKTLFASVRSKEGVVPDLIVEQRFNLKSVSPTAFGTNDVAISVDMGPLHIIDLKFGRRFVSPVRNEQLMYYALGIIEEMSLNPSEVHLWIHGPRMGLDVASQHWECPMEVLLEYHEALKKGAKRVQEEPDTYVTGDHCLYCNKGMCPKIQEEEEGFFDDIQPIPMVANKNITPSDPTPLVHSVDFKDYPTDELLKRLELKDLFTGAFSDIAAILKSRAEGGEKIPDHKLIKSYGHRTWKSDVSDEQIVQLGLPKKEIYAEPKRKTAPQIEKAIKKAIPARSKKDKDKREEVLSRFSDLIERPEKGTKLVHVNQPGDPVLPASEGFDDIDQPKEDDFSDLV